MTVGNPQASAAPAAATSGNFVPRSAERDFLEDRERTTKNTKGTKPGRVAHGTHAFANASAGAHGNHGLTETRPEIRPV
jgi:hypothetical protein